MGRGDWRDWRWDPTLFEGAAAYYERGRLPYAAGLSSALRDALELDGTGRLLDVGCGPGTIALRVVDLFEEVVGLDADEGMVAEASRLAAARGVGNAIWVHRRAEDIDPGLGTFRVVTFGASFHWMDRSAVAARVREQLVAGGALVHVDVVAQPPVAASLEELRRRYLGPDRRAGQSIRNTSPADEDDVFRAAGFAGPDVRIVADGSTVVRTVDDLVAESLSTSGGAPHLFGDRLGDFIRDARTELEATVPAGGVSVTVPDTRMRIWRRRH